MSLILSKRALAAPGPQSQCVGKTEQHNHPEIMGRFLVTLRYHFQGVTYMKPPIYLTCMFGNSSWIPQSERMHFNTMKTVATLLLLE